MTFLFRHRGNTVSLIFFFACLCSFSALAQTPASTGQVGPGKSATITPAKGVVATPPNSAPPKVLDAALTPTTRKTLQDAMNAAANTNSTQPVTPSK